MSQEHSKKYVKIHKINKLKPLIKNSTKITVPI